MTPEEEEATICEFTARGYRAVHTDDWTVALALDVVRENRRRYAASPRMRALGRVGARLAAELAEETGIAPHDIAVVLLTVSGKLGALALSEGIDGVTVTEILAFAADDLDRLATAKAAGQ